MTHLLTAEYRSLALLLTITAGILPGIAPAQDEEPAQYEVELIVFRLNDQSRTTPESTAPAPVPRDDILDGGLDGLIADDTTESPPDRIDEGSLFVPLRDDGLKLTGVYRRLQEVEAYTPLMHTGWIQQARSTTEAIPNRLSQRTGGQSRLAGSITLYKQRFLHLNIDLALESLAEAALSGGRVFGDGSFTGRPERPSIRVQESRRIRGGDVNYFDNPQLGIIVTVREVESTVATDTGTDG